MLPRPGAFLVALLLFSSTPALSQPKPPSTVDAVRGTIKGSTRFIGLGGAFVAIADDTEGVAINPASAAVRLPYAWDELSYAFGIDFSIATWLPKNDLYNAPESTSGTSGSLFGSVAAVVNYGHAGFGLAAEAQQNVVSQAQQGVSTKLTANFGLMRTVAAYGYFDGQLELGAGLRLVGFSFDAAQSVVPATAGVGYTAGVIVKPKRERFRVGAAIEQPINARLVGEPGATPATVEIPWTAAFGFAYQLGTRELNPAFVTARERARKNCRGREPTRDDEKEAARELFDEFERSQTFYLLVSAELALIEGGGDFALGRSLAVDRPLVSPRLGLETEALPRQLRVRAGSYLELPTTDAGHARLHGTCGIDVKLFEWNVFGLVRPFDYWQLSLAADGAASYLNTSFSIGFWH
ncbi:MAG TPA: hypothetical protein VGQ57_16590 [Polyangiaceae bacterium]|jgi:hypothetical protein|nr:hypothetical protein [Polyangiaceae bacterium]